MWKPRLSHRATSMLPCIGILVAIIIACFPRADIGIMQILFPHKFPERYTMIDKGLSITFYIALFLLVGFIIRFIVVSIKDRNKTSPQDEIRETLKILHPN